MDVVSGGKIGSTGTSSICFILRTRWVNWPDCPIECIDYCPNDYSDCPPLNSPPEKRPVVARAPTLTVQTLLPAPDESLLCICGAKVRISWVRGRLISALQG